MLQKLSHNIIRELYQTGTNKNYTDQPFAPISGCLYVHIRKKQMVIQTLIERVS